MAQKTLLEQYLKPKEQWGMSSTTNTYGMSLPEYHPDDPTLPTTWDRPEWIEELSKTLEDPEFSATDSTNTPLLTSSTDLSLPQTQTAFNRFMGLEGGKENLTRAQKAMFQGAILKTVASASDFFSRVTGLATGQISAIHGQRDIAIQNYQNEIDALDNQVLYLKNRLADRFNKTVETNIMTLAAKNIRVTAGNVLELSKDEAQEITEDMRMAESNARLKQIALEAGQQSARESSKYAIRQIWTGLIGSATKLGLMFETGGGTGESWGNLYKGYKNQLKMEDTIKTQSFNKLY